MYSDSPTSPLGQRMPPRWPAPFSGPKTVHCAHAVGSHPPARIGALFARPIVGSASSTPSCHAYSPRSVSRAIGAHVVCVCCSLVESCRKWDKGFCSTRAEFDIIEFRSRRRFGSTNCAKTSASAGFARVGRAGRCRRLSCTGSRNESQRSVFNGS